MCKGPVKGRSTIHFEETEGRPEVQEQGWQLRVVRGGQARGLGT